MWLPVEVVIHELFPNDPIEYNHVQKTASFEGVRLFDPTGQTREPSNYLYLISKTMLDEMPHALLSRQFLSHLTFLCVGSGELEPLDELRKNLSMVRLSIQEEFAAVFNLCGDLFQRFASWDRDIHLALLKNAPLQELLDRSRNLLRYPTLVVDPHRNILAHYLPEDNTPPVIRESVRAGRLTPAAFLLLTNIGLSPEEDQPDTLLSQVYTDEDGARFRGSSTRLRANDQEAARLIQFNCPPEDMPYHMTIMGLTHDGLTQYFRQNSYSATLSSEAYESLLADVLEHPAADPQAYRRRIATYMGQSMTGRFMLAQVDMGDRARFSPTMIAWSIRNGFPSIYPFLHRNQFYLLRCFSKKQPCRDFLPEEERETFRKLFGTEMPRIGVSNLFFSLMDLAYAAKQCALALEMKPAEIKPDVARYQEVFLPYLVSGIQSVMPMQMIASPVYALLKEHDLEHNDDLREVLMCYLNHDHNINQTAEALYMHRNTVAKKLKKIFSLTQADCRADSDAMAFTISYFSDGERDH